MKAFRATAILTIVISAFAAGVVAEPFVDLDQNWSETDRNDWYGSTQGSRLLPLAWLEALEQPDSTNLFLADAHIAKFRFLPRAGELPIGFAIDSTPKRDQRANESWVGLNCAACHTSQITYKGNRMTVEGGPALADFQGFIETLNRALVQTRDDTDKFNRFAGRVLANRTNDAADREPLKQALSDLIEWQLKVERMNATDLRYGYGRLDAFGHIFNKVVLVANPDKKVARDADSAGPEELEPLPSNAPVSYPFLWNVPQQTFVQWNASAPNRKFQKIAGFDIAGFGDRVDLAALARNVGEVIGVFGDLQATPAGESSGDEPKTPQFKSSMQLENLVAMEKMLIRLRPPAWPAIFPPPDPKQVAIGKKLFAKECSHCHGLLPRTDLTTEIKIDNNPMFRDIAKENRTDPAMTCNAFTKQAPSGVLEGAEITGAGDKSHLKAFSPVGDMLKVTVAGALANRKQEIKHTIVLSLLGWQPRPIVVRHHFGAARPKSAQARKRLARKEALDACLPGAKAYKARPLNGMWATAPYLHNGSVPTLYDLLLPPRKRPKAFYVGSTEFDPEKVGFVTKRSAENSFHFETQDASSDLIDGNSNAGHTYGTELSDPDRRALVEYLKTL
jgi:mono/diheme cytochrome c family protein